MARVTPVVWLSYHKPDIIERGYWDQGLLEDIFAEGEYEHYTNTRDVGGGGAIVILNGRTHTGDIPRLNEDIAMLKWCLFIDTGDEESIFPWREVKHPLMKVYMMLPRVGQHDDVHLRIPNGYRPTTKKLLREMGRQERTNDWFFAGQVNHPRREECVRQLRSLSGGTLVETSGFGREVMDYPTYLKTMASSKIVLCPSGIESPDNFRLYEALEAGCLPIVDAYSTNNPIPGFWRYLFGDDIPFPIVNGWGSLPELMPRLLAGWPQNANRAFSWWLMKKRELKYRLEDDVRSLNYG